MLLDMTIKNKKLFGILLILLIIISGFLLFNPFEKTYIEIIKINNSSFIEVDTSQFNKPSMLNSIRSIFSSPFELNYYELYIEDNTDYSERDKCNHTKIIYNMSIDGEYFSFTFDENKKINSFRSNVNHELKLEGIRIEKNVLESKDFEVCPLPKPKFFIKPNLWESLVKIIIFIFSFFTLIILLKEVNSIFFKLKENTNK